MQRRRTGKEDLPAWTRKAIEINWQQVLEDVEASNAYMKNTMKKNTDFLRHVVSEKEEELLRSRVFVSTASSQWKTSCGGKHQFMVTRRRNNWHEWVVVWSMRDAMCLVEAEPLADVANWNHSN